MKFEDIKVGETYNVRVRVMDINDKTYDITTETVDSDGKLTRNACKIRSTLPCLTLKKVRKEAQ